VFFQTQQVSEAMSNVDGNLTVLEVPYFKQAWSRPAVLRVLWWRWNIGILPSEFSRWF